MGSSSSSVALLALLALLLVNFSPVASQGCVSSLVPCSNYLTNTVRPGSDCCNPLSAAASTNISCLCDLAKLASSSSVNVTRALELPVLCNIPGVNASTCNITFAPAPGSAVLPPPPQSGVSETPSSAPSTLIISSVTFLGLFIASSGLLLAQ